MFDPTKPAHHSPTNSAEMREQLNSLKALIDAQGAEIAMLQGQVAGLLAALDSVPPGQPTLALQYAGGLDVPMTVTAPPREHSAGAATLSGRDGVAHGGDVAVLGAGYLYGHAAGIGGV